jgi:hypothetical protein
VLPIPVTATTWDVGGAFVQFAGIVRSRVAFAVTRVDGPLLVTLAVTVTSKALLRAAWAGASTAKLVTWRSAWPITSVLNAVWILVLLAGVGSVTRGVVIARVLVKLKLWLQRFGQLTVNFSSLVCGVLVRAVNVVGLPGTAVMVQSAAPTCRVSGDVRQKGGG